MSRTSQPETFESVGAELDSTPEPAEVLRSPRAV